MRGPDGRATLEFELTQRQVHDSFRVVVCTQQRRQAVTLVVADIFDR